MTPTTRKLRVKEMGGWGDGLKKIADCRFEILD
jgi:hypothetical protein